MSGHEEDDLNPSETPGYKVTAPLKSAEEYAKMDANDESLNKWKASLGITAAAGEPAPDGPKMTVLSLELISPTLTTPLVLDLTDPSKFEGFKKNPITIKEGIEYQVQIKFKVNHSIVSGVRYIQLVKRSGIKVDKLEEMLGSFGPTPEPYVKKFLPEESPTGMLARSGTYHVRSRVVDDDKGEYANFEWYFKIGKEW